MMITTEEIAAYADGELAGERKMEVAAMVAADPDLAQQVTAHMALKDQLGAHFAPILKQELPERLTKPLQTKSGVVDFEAAKDARAPLAANDDAPIKRRLGWIVGPALAASLAIAVFLPRGGEAPDGYAGTELATLLDSQLVAEQRSGAETRILLSFQNDGGEFCRAFSGGSGSGIACRDGEGWHLRHSGNASTGQSTEFRQAGNTEAELMAAVQDMAAGPALNGAEEKAARSQDWQ